MSIYVTPHRLPVFIGESRDQRYRGTAPAPGGPAFVQGATANSSTGTPASLDVVLGSPATAGNLIVVGANSDATLTGPAGFSTAASAIAGCGCYLFYKIAAGGETTLTVTPSVSDTVAIAAAEYSGILASPLDQTATSSATGSTTGPVSAGTTGATVQASELVLAVTGVHRFPVASQPNTPTWTGGFVTRGDTASSYATDAQNAAVFLGELVVSATGTQTTATSWTNAANDWAAVIATFKGA